MMSAQAGRKLFDNFRHDPNSISIYARWVCLEPGSEFHMNWGGRGVQDQNFANVAKILARKDEDCYRGTSREDVGDNTKPYVKDKWRSETKCEAVKKFRDLRHDPKRLVYILKQWNMTVAEAKDLDINLKGFLDDLARRQTDKGGNVK